MGESEYDDEAMSEEEMEEEGEEGDELDDEDSDMIVLDPDHVSVTRPQLIFYLEKIATSLPLVRKVAVFTDVCT